MKANIAVWVFRFLSDICKKENLMKQVVLITGASTGIGKAIGEYLAEKDYVVYGTSRNPDTYPDSKFPLLQLDVRNPQSISVAVASLLTKESHIDILINNAGVGITGPIEETPEEEIKNVFDVNLYGPIRVTKAVLPQMRLQRSGLIINITSIAGYMGLPYRGFYSASKGALELVTEALRMETKQFGIAITNVAPGDFATNIAAGRYHAPLKDDSPYKAQYGNTLELMNTHVDSGENPLKMAQAIHAIIRKGNPKVRYKIGNLLQKVSVRLKNTLPGTWFEKMLMQHYKL